MRRVAKTLLLSRSDPSRIRNTLNFTLITRLLTTVSSSDDNLEGLVDPEDSSVSRTESISSEELGFLRDSLLKPNSSSSSSAAAADGKLKDEAFMVADVISNVNDQFGKETLKLLKRHREKLSESLVIEVLKLLNSPELGLRFFIWAGQQIGYSHTLPAYDALLELLQRNNGDDGRIPEQFLQQIESDDKEVLGKLLNVLIRRCCRNGLWNVALEELGRLKDYGYKPPRSTYNALVQVFLRAERLDTASLVHKEMSDLGYAMDGFTLGCFAHSLCKAGKWREALKLIEDEEFKPDTVLFTNMISGLCKASLFEVAMDFLTRMRVHSCIPNVLTYRTLLCGCLRKKQLGRCKRILNMMITEGCYPSPAIFNSLVDAYCKSGDYAYAYKVIKKMTECGFQPGYVVYNIFIGSVCGNQELPEVSALELAEKAYREMLAIGITLNKVNVSSLAWCLCGAGKFEDAYSIISEMMSKGFIPDTSTYSKVITHLCNSANVEKAFLLFEEMRKNEVPPDVYTYTQLIDSFCKVGLIEQARRWFDEMESNGCNPNVVTYTALIHAYLKAKKVSNANEVFELMLSKGSVPNVVTYTALIDGHCKAGEIEKACKIYSRMKQDNAENSEVDRYFGVVDTESEEPNLFTYGALVDGLCKAHRVKDARELLEAMLASGCQPNHIIYDALVDGCCKVGKLDEAQEVFTMMIENGYNPNVYSYSSLIDRLFKDKRLDLALKVLSKMLENSCAPNVVIYTEMVDGLCKVGKTDEAYKLMVMMEEKSCHPNVVTYTAMIDGFGKSGRVDKCLQLFQKMVSKGCAPNFVTYKVLINHCCAAGLLDEALKLLEEMKATHWPKHVAGYRKVVEGFSSEFIASLELLDEFSEKEAVPVSSIYRVLIDNFAKAGRLEMALELYKEVSSILAASEATRNMYISLIEGLALANKVDKAFDLYVDMNAKGIVPEVGTFVHLIKGLLRFNRWDQALQLSDGICQAVCFHDMLSCIIVLCLNPVLLSEQIHLVRCKIVFLKLICRVHLLPLKEVWFLLEVYHQLKNKQSLRL
ncbi:Pentatricopeptide repeat-containing protein At1g06710, mitochondrial [Linum perenne]